MHTTSYEKRWRRIEGGCFAELHRAVHRSDNPKILNGGISMLCNSRPLPRDLDDLLATHVMTLWGNVINSHHCLTSLSINTSYLLLKW